MGQGVVAGDVWGRGGNRSGMIVTGALPWWNERPADLAACVRGLGNIVDRVIALDGAYARYPEGTPQSAEAQVEAIERAADAVGIDCLVLQPHQLWAGQVEKRSYLLAAASVNSDWICTVDADHVIHTERQAARSALSKVALDVVEVPYVTPPHPKRSMEDSAVGTWHKEQTVKPVLIPHLYRALPGMRIERFHWWYSALKDGRRVWLWSADHDSSYPHVKRAVMRVPYEVEHRALMRTAKQIRLSRGFLNDREMVVRKTGQEDDQAGLPEPKYDYGKIPK